MAARRAPKHEGPRKRGQVGINRRLARDYRSQGRHVDEACMHRTIGEHHEANGKRSWAASAFRDAADAFKRAAEGKGQTRGMGAQRLREFEAEMLAAAKRNSRGKK